MNKRAVEKKIIRIIPFFIVTLVVFGSVEQLYTTAENYLLTFIGDLERKRESRRLQRPKDIELHKNYTVIMKRNLFHSQKKNDGNYTKEEIPETVELKKTDLALILVGTITGKEGQDRAIISDRVTGKQQEYFQGDEIQGAYVRRILRGKVILSHNGKDEVLDLTEARETRVEEDKKSDDAQEKGEKTAKGEVKKISLKEFMKSVSDKDVKILVKEKDE